MAVVPHPPYSPDPAPCNFFFLPKMKSMLQGRRFRDVSENQELSLTALSAIQKGHF